MEAKFDGKAHHFYGPLVSDLKAVGKKTMEWDLNDWKWDGDLLTAAPLTSVPSNCRGRQFFPIGSEIPTNTRVSNSFSSGSDEMTLGFDKEKRELEKRRRVFDVEDEDLTDEVGSLNLKLGGQVYPIAEGDAEKWEGKSGKKTKVIAPSYNRAVCQVEDCRADLSNAKDYHRRHKVCDMHSKATRALVGNVMQRFCQQCSRFHVLQEFDEGKRSCRRRLAGHNKRRRKTHPENVVSGVPANDERGSNYLLISLLRILSNIHTNNSSDQSKDQDLLAHLLRSLASFAGMVNERNLTGLLPGSQELQNAGTSDGTQTKEATRSIWQCATAPSPELAQKRFLGNDDQDGILQNPSPSQSTLLFPTKESTKANGFCSTGGRTKINNIDLNNVYDDSEGCLENLQSSDGTIHLGKASPGCPLQIYQDPHKSSPPHTSGNSGSTSTLSPSSSNGEAQSRTDRIVFKLFGKDPSDFPLVLRKQILDWLSNSPTDIESYIRPGCVILTIYLRMDKSTWEQLSYDLSSYLRRLVDASTDSFWRTGWIYTRVHNRVAFVYDGHIVLDTPLPDKSLRSCRIVSIKPIAVCASDKVKFSVKGFNLSQPTTRLRCALEGKYLVHESSCDVMAEAESFIEHVEIQILSYNCTIPNLIGRGFIEVEDHGLSSSFFPFIIADKDVCSEICTLESIFDAATETAGDIQGGFERLEATNQALDFVHEMGWLLHKCQLKFRLGQTNPNLDLFPFKRFRWLIEYSIEHDWCAVVKNLLNILFKHITDSGQHSSVEDALLDIGLLHRAVRRNSRPMVEVLLRYQPDGHLNEWNLNKGHYLFRPDLKGPGGLTPLHIAAGRDGSEHVLDALTEDPGVVGVEAWRSARDSTGLTPNDYACLRGHYSYIHLVQKKINKKAGSQHVVLEIPGSIFESSMKQKLADGSKLGKVAGLQTEKSVVRPNHMHCRQCEQKLFYGRARTSLAIYRPAMLSMVAIAAVCVCVALLFKSSPEVVYVFQPFRWELLEYGSS